MHWDIMDTKEIGISEHTHWSRLRDYDELAQGTGVFIFADDEHKVKYIGKAGPRKFVEDIAQALAKGKGEEATMLMALYMKNGQSAKHVYRLLINKSLPPNNMR